MGRDAIGFPEHRVGGRRIAGVARRPEQQREMSPGAVTEDAKAAGSTPYSFPCWRMKRTERRMPATIDDKGYLGQLPCRTAKTVNPLSFKGG